ncbi:MAG: cytosine permease [Tissierellia bacterium]|nr:cytosine permease [Tissierellia bacterium]
MEREDQLAIRPVPENERVGWGAPLFNMLGTNIAISELMVGGTLIAGMTFSNLLFTSIIGNLILAIIVAIQGNIGAKEGLNTYTLAESIFGEKGGRYIISVILAISSFGWFGIQAGVAGLSVQKIFPGINLTLITIILGLLMMIFAVFGFKSMAKFNYVAVPALIVLIMWGLFKSLAINGVASIGNYVPSETMSLSEGLNLVIGLIIVGAVISPDQLRFTRGLKDILIVGFLGFAIISVFQQVAAGILAMNSPSWDITQVLADLGFGTIAFLILLLASWSTNVGNAYSGGLALKNILPNMKRERLTLIAGVVGTIIAATGIIFRFQNFLSLLSTTIAPMVGVMWTDYYILNKQKLIYRKETNFVGIAAWIVGSIVSFVTGRINFFIPPINGVIVSAIIYLLASKLSKREVSVN